MKYSLEYYQQRIDAAEKLNDAILAEFEKDLPVVEDLKLQLGYQTYLIPILDSKYKRRRSYVQDKLGTAQRFHAKVSLLVKDYYSTNNNRHDIEEYEMYGWNGLFKMNITPPERQAWIDQDEVYQHVTTWMAKHQANLELVNDNIKALTERGRQYKTVMEFMRFNNGEV